MKILRSFVVLLVFFYFSFMCSKGPGDEHDHADHDHSSEMASEHEHEDHEHEHEEADHPHEHEHEHEEEAHTHDDGTTHTHDDGTTHTHVQADKQPQTHTHDDGTTHTHDDEPDTEGLITVEGEWEELVGLETTAVIRMPIERIISVPGQIKPDQNQIAVVSPFIESSVNCVLVNVGDRVKKGDELICLTSPEIGMLRAEYDKAKAELEIDRQNFERRQKLYSENIISERAFQEAELGKKVAEVNYNYAMKKLLAIGITEDELDNPPTGHSHAVGSTIHMHAPISGIITRRDACTGQKVNPSTRLLEIIDLKTVWCEADIFEKDLTRIKIGQKVKVRVSAYPEDIFTGRIFYIGSTLEPDTKTIKILIEIDNKSEKLKPGMFANTNICIGEKKNTLVIAKEAVLEDEGLQIVFVKESQEYHRHVVKTGIVSDPFIEILSGLAAGDIVVTKGNYQLKSELKMSGTDPHAGHQH